MPAGLVFREHDMLTEPLYAYTDVLLPEPPTAPIPDISLDAVVVFPLIAVALVTFFPIFGKIASKTTSQSERNRLRRRRSLGRVSVAVMMLSALVSAAWPLWPLDPLGRSLQALLICTIVLVPPWLWHGILTAIQSRASERKLAAARERSERGTDRVIGEDGELAGITAEGVGAPGASTPEAGARDTRASGPRAPGARTHGAPIRGARTPGAWASSAWSSGVRTSRTAMRRVPDGEYPDDDPSDVDEQLDRLVALVDSHDLGEPGRPRGTNDRPIPAVPIASARAAASTVTTDGARTGDGERPSGPSADGQAARGVGTAVRAELDPDALRATARELRGLKGDEVVRLVRGLRVDRKRLQRLVIAQRAAHESERQAHARTRSVARDAVRLAHTSRASQRLAEKAVRRERRDRKRVEEKYVRVANALHGVMSIVEAERGERAGDVEDGFRSTGREMARGRAFGSS